MHCTREYAVRRALIIKDRMSAEIAPYIRPQTHSIYAFFANL